MDDHLIRVFSKPAGTQGNSDNEFKIGEHGERNEDVEKELKQVKMEKLTSDPSDLARYYT